MQQGFDGSCGPAVLIIGEVQSVKRLRHAQRLDSPTAPAIVGVQNDAVFTGRPTALVIDEGQCIDAGRARQGLLPPLTAVVVVERAIFTRDPSQVG